MAQNKFTTALIVLGISAGLSVGGQLHAQASPPGPMLPAAKITSDNPLGLTIDHAAISVMNLDEVASFYQNVLGFKEVESGNWGPHVRFRTLAIPGVFRIDVVQRAGSARHSPVGRFDMEQGLLHLCFKTTDLDAAHRYVASKTANLRLTKNPEGTITEMFVIDPEGNELELQR